MTELLTMKKRIFLLFLSIMMLCMANGPLHAAVVIPDGIIIEETLSGEEELMPMGASGCYRYWVPDSWNLQYMDQTMAQIVQSNGWSLGGITINSSNERTQVLYGASGQKIGNYHIDHKLFGKITQSHDHLDNDVTNIHYVLYR